RAKGERSAALLSTGLVKVAAALVLTAPFTPMLFMGEEWAAGTPWQYFTDHGDERIAGLVRTGRREEFGSFGWRPEEVPDPQDPATFTRSKLDWTELDRSPHREVLAWHRELIALRRAVPALGSGALGETAVSCSADARWLVLRRGDAAVAVNLADSPQRVPLDGAPQRMLLASEDGWSFTGDAVELPAESVAICWMR